MKGDFKTEAKRAWQLSRLATISVPYHWWRVFGTLKDPEGGTGDQAAARGLGRALSRYMRLDVRVIGAEKLEGLENYVVLPNHSSYIDWAVLLGYFPVQPRFVAKRGLANVPVVGSYLKARGVMIDRSAGAQAREAIRQALQVESRWPLLIFPEGTRSMDGELRPFKRAGISLVAEAGRTMVPVALVGTWETFAPDARTIDRGRQVRIVICDPIDPAELGVERACKAVEEAVATAYAEHRPHIA